MSWAGWDTDTLPCPELSQAAGGGGAGDSISHFAETVPAVGEEGEQGVCGGVGSLGLQEGSRLAVGRRVQLQTDCAGSSTSSPLAGSQLSHLSGGGRGFKMRRVLVYWWH